MAGVLAADALQGIVYRIDTAAGSAEIAAADDAFAGSPGVNGIKIRDGYAYFTNTAARTSGRFTVKDAGAQAGPVEIVAGDASADDFALDAASGAAYLGRQESPAAVVRVLPDGTKQDVAAAASMGRPCSLDFAAGGKIGYVTTASGQVFQFDIPAI